MIEANNSPIAIGKRLRWLRNTARLTIAEFAELAQISNPSISYWENGLIDNPIKSKSMSKVVEGFKKIDIHVSERWLRSGEGELPTYKGEIIVWNENEDASFVTKEHFNQSGLIESGVQLAKILGEEIKLFSSIEQAVITRVTHSHMIPFLEKGDLVGGLWQNASNLSEPTVCILKLTNKLEVASVKRSSKKGLFDIFYSDNLSQLQQSSSIKQLHLDKFAPILRMWRLS